MFSIWFAPRTARAICKTPRPPLQVEALEDRVVPATLLGLTSTDRLVMFDSARPGVLLQNVKVSGLQTGESLVSIDTRPATGVVYGLSTTNRLYTLNPYTGKATQVTVGAAAFALSGKNIAIDFNPTVDRLRVATTSEQNFRINPNTGAIVDSDGNAGNGTQPDTPLAYDPGDTNNGVNPNVAAVAYDRNFQGAAQTTLFGIDAGRNALVRIGGVNGTPSPNGGLLFTVGALGVNPGPHIGLDISAQDTAFAAMTDGNGAGTTRLYTIDLMSGAATAVGKIGTTKLFFDGLTTLSREEILYGITQSNRLVSFHANAPEQLLSARPLLGLLTGETIRSMDFRPASGELFALTSLNRMLSVNVATGQTTQLGAQVDTTAFPTGFAVGFDFIPTSGRLRLVNTNDNNLQYDPLSYEVITPSNTSLSYITGVSDPNEGENPNVVELAYDRNDNDPATFTTQFGIDSTNDILVRIGGVDGTPSPNGGVLSTIGSLGVNTTDNVGFDIIDAGTAGNGAALAVMQLNGDTVSKLFTINLTAGLTNQPQGGAMLVGTVGGGEVLTAMAIAPPTIQFTAAAFTVKNGPTTAKITLTRTGGADSAATVRFDTVDGTAFAGVHYTAVLNQVVTFNPGATTQTVSIPILKAVAGTGKRTVHITLTSPTGGTTRLGNVAVSILTITQVV